LQIAKYIARDHNVLFASLEMLPEAVLDKLAAGLISKPTRLIRRGGYSDELLDEITLSLGKLAECNLYLCHGPATTVSLRQLLERMKLSYGLDIAFIDYLQLLRDRYRSNPNDRVTFISGELANIAKEFNIPLVVLSQLSRAPEGRADKRPLLSDLRESGAIEQDADLILFLYRDSYYKRDINPHGAETELLIDKDRLRAITGKFTRYWDGQYEKYVCDRREITGYSQSQKPTGQQVDLV
jgi:replicative DNA helicase